MEKEKFITEITQMVEYKRGVDNITPTPGAKRELSGTAYGEAFVFVDNLLYTTDGTGAWKELPALEEDFLIEVLAELKK